MSTELVCNLMSRTPKLLFQHLIHSSGLITEMGDFFIVIISF